MRVVLIANLPPRNSPEADHAFHLARHLAGRGLEVHVLTTADSTTAVHPRVRVHPVGRCWSWTELPGLAALLRRIDPDAVLLVFVYWSFGASSMVTFLPTVVRTLLPRARFVTLFEDAAGVSASVHTPVWEPGLIPRALRKAIVTWAGRTDVDPLYGTLLRDSHQLIAVSGRVRAVLAHRLADAAEKTEVIPVPPVLFMTREGTTTRGRRRAALGVHVADYLLTYFGYVYPGKGIETLLAAFRRVRLRRPEARLLISGGNLILPERPAYGEEMRTLARHLGVADRTHWSGGFRWDADDGSQDLRATDACVLPYDDGVCVHNSSFAAAVAHGLPVITTQGKATDCLLTDRHNVLLCPPRDPDALAAAVESLMSDPGLSLRLRAEAIRLHDEHFAWEKIVPRVLAALQ